MSNAGRNSGAGRNSKRSAQGGGGVANAMGSLDAFMSNEKELGTVFNGKNTERARDVRRAAHKKEAFLNELVHIKLKDPTGYVADEWKIVRKRISAQKVKALIGRSPLPETEVDFFYDSNGVPIWMEDLLINAQPTPNFYTIVPEVKRFPTDIRIDPQYEGQTAFLVKQVPLKSKDEETTVDEKTIREWMVCAIVEEDPLTAPLASKLEPVKEIIKEIDKKIKKVSKMVFLDEEGQPMKDEKAEEEREHIYEQFGQDRLNAEKRLKKYERNLEAHIIWRKSIGMQLSIEEVDENTDTASWRVRFFGHKDALAMENLLIKKDNWAGIRVANSIPASKDTPEAPPYAVRGPLPDGSNPALPDYSGAAVNVAGARFMRVPHGVGSVKALDRSSATIADDHFGVYYGRFDLGERVGVAFEMDDVSVYSGKFLHNFKKGSGRLDYGDGTTIVGNFRVNTQVQNKQSLIFDNPYMDGEPNDDVEILFGDGAVYKGNMKDGRIQGQGEYRSALGEILLGNFVDGVLDGKDNYRENAAGEKFKGEFDMGEINNYGIYENKRGDKYAGYWDHSLRHGRGMAKYHKLGRYRGYFVNGTRNGKAELEYGLRPKKKKKKVKEGDEEKGSEGENKDKGEGEKEKGEIEALDSEFMKIFQGYFMADEITNGGTTMSLDTQRPSVISRRDARRLLPITHVLTQNTKNMKRIQREVEKLNDMEQFIRKEIVQKKMKIFRQQRHFTKKSMYATDTWGSFPKSELTSRNVIRERRLKNQDEHVLRPKHALVPNLQNIPIHPMKHLTEIYEHVVPDPSLGNPNLVKLDFLKAAVSDYEEIVERQRYLKYDLIWKRAESHFSNKKRAMKEAMEG
jgi:hypothetical protein